MPSIRKSANSPKKTKISKLPIKKIDIFLVFLVLLANLFFLPSLPPHHLYPQAHHLSPAILASDLYNYRRPPQPVVKSTTNPYLLAPSYILLDQATNTILLQKNPDLRIYPASLTKLATAITALNLYPLDDVVTIDQSYTEGKVMELVVGEKITIRSLVTALLVHSANDAGFTLANYHPRGLPGFITEMNQLMSRYSLTNTNFVNYDGIHQPNHYSTVYDLSQLARLAIKNPVITEVVKLPQLTVSDIGNTIHHSLVSTNELLGLYPEIQGLKTGWTPEAGGCFIGLFDIADHQLISVVVQSPDRFADTTSLLSWAKENIVWTQTEFTSPTRQ